MSWAAWYRRARARRQTLGDEAGITLIELLVVMVIMPMVIGAIAFAFVEILSLQGGVSKSIADSADAQVVSANFVKDVEGAQELTISTSTSFVTCGTGQPLVAFGWGQYTTPTNSGYSTIVAYDWNSSEGTLWRTVCTNGVDASSPVATQLPGPAGLPNQPSISFAATNPYTAGDACDTGTWPPDISSPTPSNPNGNPNQWICTAGVTGVTLTVIEPNSHYSYTLTADPSTSESEGGTTELTNGAPASSYFADNTPQTTYANSLSFLDMSDFCWAQAAGSNTTATNQCTNPTIPTEDSQACTTSELSATGWPAANGWGGQWMTIGIARTPFVMSFCVHAGSTGGTGTAEVGAVSIPTYYDPTGGAPNTTPSEAYLGNNGFYAGVGGEPALYQCLEPYTESDDGWSQSAGLGNEIATTCPNGDNANGADTTLSFGDISIETASGTKATGWDLVTGDAESTDNNEWIAWTTCPTIAKTTGNVPGTDGPPAGDIYSGTCTNQPNLVLLPNNTTEAFPQIGNACAYPGYTYTPAAGSGWSGESGYYLEWTNGDSNAPVAPNSSSSVECTESNASNKTGTAMFEAATPTNLTVNMAGEGVQAIFLGVLE